jgi:hypothetical protein
VLFATQVKKAQLSQTSTFENNKFKILGYLNRVQFYDRKWNKAPNVQVSF